MIESNFSSSVPWLTMVYLVLTEVRSPIKMSSVIASDLFSPFFISNKIMSGRFIELIYFTLVIGYNPKIIV